MPDTYKIVRFYMMRPDEKRIIKRHLTLDQAQAHCQQCNTRDQKHDPPHWFDGYTKEGG